MKKLLYILAAAGLLAGCTRDYDPGRGGVDGCIRFGATTTRAAVATVVDLRGGFRVFASGAGASSAGDWYPGIDGTNDHVFVDGQWGFETPVPWPDDQSEYPLDFYAWYPADETAGPVVTTADPTADPVELRGTFSVAPTPGRQVDFLAARTQVTTRPPFGDVSMTFRHALSKIDIGIAAGKGTSPVIQAMGVARVGGERTYDFVAGEWTAAQPADVSLWYPYFGTLDFQSGGIDSAVPVWAPGIAATEGSISHPFTSQDAAHLMLMPQTGAPWQPGGGDDGAMIYLLYRMDDEVGYERYTEGSYDGPLYVLAGFPISSGASFTWEPGKGYTYIIALGTLGSGNGYLLSEYYYDERGAQTAIPVRDGRRVGEKLRDGVIHVSLTVGDWEDEIVGISAPIAVATDAGTQIDDLGLFCTYTGERPWSAAEGIDKMFDRRLVRSGSPEGRYDYWAYADGAPARWETGDPVTNPGASAADCYTFFAYSPHASAANGLRVLDPQSEVAAMLGREAGLPHIVYVVPASQAAQPDLLVAGRRENIHPTGNPVPLAMNHALTAVRFNFLGQEQLLASVSIRGFCDRGVLELDGGADWDLRRVASDGSVLPSPLAADPLTTVWMDVPLAAGSVLMMIPQTLGNSAQLRLTFADGSIADRIISLAGGTWRAGGRITYSLLPGDPDLETPLPGDDW